MRVFMPSRDFWVPDTKEQIIGYLAKQYQRVPVSKWKTMAKDRLLAIYIAIRTRRG